ncbi:MAG: DNA glycosylase [Tissierellia bacterium]|nr:DNA glycosylase [Tissierellia bacterium]
MENKVVISSESFEPEHIFESGQCFRWNKVSDDIYKGVVNGKIITTKKCGDKIEIYGIDQKEFEDYFENYFDLKTDYKKIKELYSKDPQLKLAIEYGHGLRVLNQDPFETMLSFIISANNQIPRIKRSIKLLSKHFGEYIDTIDGEEFYKFPTPQVLASAKVEDIRELTRVGFRDYRIVRAAQMVVSEEIKLDELYDMKREEAKKVLMQVPGIGSKVADCILLFALQKKDAFPVDVWIKRIMETLYLNREVNVKDIADYGREVFGENAGIAQQYLFYYGRENKIGK